MFTQGNGGNEFLPCSVWFTVTAIRHAQTRKTQESPN